MLSKTTLLSLDQIVDMMRVFGVWVRLRRKTMKITEFSSLIMLFKDTDNESQK
jgi:hypothetical protein